MGGKDPQEDLTFKRGILVIETVEKVTGSCCSSSVAALLCPAYQGWMLVKKLLSHSKAFKFSEIYRQKNCVVYMQMCFASIFKGSEAS